MSYLRMNLVVAALLLVFAGPLFAQTVPPATPEQEAKLLAVLQSDAPLKEKTDACRQLAVVGTKESVPVLAGLLGNEQLAHMARYALEPIPDPAVEAALREAAGKLKGRPLAGVIGSLGVRRDTASVTLLAKFLQDADPPVAETAARSLGKIGSLEAAQALQQALATSSQDRRPAVADGCLGCAEALLAAGQRAKAAEIYKSVSEADLPKHFRIAAVQGALLVQQVDPAP